MERRFQKYIVFLRVIMALLEADFYKRFDIKAPTFIRVIESRHGMKGGTEFIYSFVGRLRFKRISEVIFNQCDLISYFLLMCLVLQ